MQVNTRSTKRVPGGTIPSSIKADAHPFHADWMEILTTVHERFDMNKPQPSPLVRRFASKIAVAAGSSPIVDVACGSGRNALFLDALGCTVIGIDNDPVRLEALRRASSNGSGVEESRLSVKRIDLIKDSWPFGPRSLGAVVNVHFFLPKLLVDFENSIMPRGHLLFETVPGCGGNYLELPKRATCGRPWQEHLNSSSTRNARLAP